MTLLSVTLSVLGVTAGALAASVAALQMILVPFSALSLGAAHYLAHRRGRPRPRRQQIILWSATALSGTFLVLALLR